MSVDSSVYLSVFKTTQFNMRVNFYLDTNSIDKENRKLLFVYIRGIGKTNGKYNKIMLNTGFRFKATEFDAKSGLISKHSYKGYWNTELYKLKTAIEKFYNESDTSKLDQFKINLKDYLIENKLIDSNKKEVVNNFYTIFDSYLEYKYNNSKISKATVQKYTTLKNHLNNFEQSTKIAILLEDINIDFKNRFVQYLRSSKNLGNNTVKKILVWLKTFLIWSYENEKSQNKIYEKSEFIEIDTYESEIYPLNNEELIHLIKFDFSANQRLDQIRDAFCFSCLTGGRYSDISKLTWNDLKNDTWDLRVEKTIDWLHIPLNQHAVNILNKYKSGANPFPIPSSQKTNHALKQIFKIAKFDYPVKLTKYVGKEKTVLTLPYHEYISFHDGRRSFITLCLAKGMTYEEIRTLTGHKDYKTFQKYIKVAGTLVRKRFMEAWDGAND